MKPRMQKVGLIEIKVYRQLYGKKDGPVEASTNLLRANERKAVPEKSVKSMLALSNFTTLGDGYKVFKGDVWKESRKKDGEEFPLGIFRFMYRSKEALRQNGVIGREPSPSPSPSPSREPTPDFDHVTEGEDGLTPFLRRKIEEELRLERERRIEQAKAGAAAAAAANSKKRNASSEEAIKIKKEMAKEERRVARKKAKENAGRPTVVIDLISDDEDEAPSTRRERPREIEIPRVVPEVLSIEEEAEGVAPETEAPKTGEKTLTPEQEEQRRQDDSLFVAE